jgi:hypothetical protein
VIFNNLAAHGRNAAMRAGWNDAAWGRPHRAAEAARARWYECGYASRLVVRHRQQSNPAGPGSSRTVCRRLCPPPSPDKNRLEGGIRLECCEKPQAQLVTKGTRSMDMVALTWMADLLAGKFVRRHAVSR